jgi:hypothetical protein
MKKCNCRHCGREFTVRKPMPFCSGTCRIAHHHYQQTKPTTHEGVTNEFNSTEYDQ